MKNTIRLNFFSDSKKWHRRIPKIKKISPKIINKMNAYFKKSYFISLNLIFSDKKRMKKLNAKYKNEYKDTDVLTFVSKISNKELGIFLYCDIFFSIDTIENYIIKNNLDLYDHYTHLLIHSVLHINGHDHKNSIQFNKMKKEEIKILKNLNIKNPYIY